LEKHLRYLSDFFSAIVKCTWKKIFEKSVDLITPVLIKIASINKKTAKKSLQCLSMRTLELVQPFFYLIWILKFLGVFLLVM